MLPLTPKFKCDRLTSQKDFHAGAQHVRRHAPRLDNAPLFFQPAFPARYKIPRKPFCSLAGNGHDDRFGEMQTQDIVARARVPAVEYRHAMRMDFDDIALTRRHYRRDQPEKLSEFLHQQKPNLAGVPAKSKQQEVRIFYCSHSRVATARRGAES